MVSTFSRTDAFQGYQTSVKRRLRTVQYCSFPPEGVNGTSGYRFEYNLYLIEIQSHLDRESIYNAFMVEFLRLYSLGIYIQWNLYNADTIELVPF